MAKSLVLYSSCSLHRRKDYLQKYEGDDFAVISTAQIHPFIKVNTLWQNNSLFLQRMQSRVEINDAIKVHHSHIKYARVHLLTILYIRNHRRLHFSEIDWIWICWNQIHAFNHSTLPFAIENCIFPQKPADMINGSILCIWSGPLLMKVAEDIMSGLHPTVLCKSTLTTKHKQTDTARIQIEDFANDFADTRL